MPGATFEFPVADAQASLAAAKRFSALYAGNSDDSTELFTDELTVVAGDPLVNVGTYTAKAFLSRRASQADRTCVAKLVLAAPGRAATLTYCRDKSRANANVAPAERGMFFAHTLVVDSDKKIRYVTEWFDIFSFFGQLGPEFGVSIHADKDVDGLNQESLGQGTDTRVARIRAVAKALDQQDHKSAAKKLTTKPIIVRQPGIEAPATVNVDGLAKFFRQIERGATAVKFVVREAWVAGDWAVARIQQSYRLAKPAAAYGAFPLEVVVLNRLWLVRFEGEEAIELWSFEGRLHERVQRGEYSDQALNDSQAGYRDTTDE